MNANPELIQTGRTSKKGGLARTVFLILAGLFAFGIVLQVFLAGVALMVDGDYLNMHRGIGYLVIFLTLPMLIADLAGRVSSRTRWMAIAAVTLSILQYVLIAAGDSVPILRAFHPVNALALFGLSIGLVRVALAERSADHQPPAGRKATIESGMEAAGQGS